jgi:site-specific DNA recombinase
MASMAAIYARVSSQRQKEGHTVGSQTAALRELAGSQGLEVPAEWEFEDEGVSGATLIRPELERLRDLAARGQVEVVLCHSPDRLARRYAYQVLLIEEFARTGTEVRFARGRKAESPEDELLLQFQGMIAEYERAQITERHRRGKIYRARMGCTNVLSGAPYGYRYVRRDVGQEARYEIVESQAAVVRQIYARYTRQGASIGTLARWLTKQEIPTATGKAKWDRSVVWAILRNPAYCGRAAFGKTMVVEEPPRITRPVRRKGIGSPRRPAKRDRPREEWIEIPVPAIISEDDFSLASRRLEENKRLAARRTREPSLLQGLVACRSCGYAYYRTSTRTRRRRIRYYRCLGSDHYRWEAGAVCHNRPVREDYLDALVWDHVSRLLLNPELVRDELQWRLNEQRSNHPAKVQQAKLEQELKRTTSAIDRLVVAYQEDLLSLPELRERMPSLRKKQATLRANLEAAAAQLLDQETYLKLAENLESFLSRLQAGIANTTIEERQRVVRLVVKEVLVDTERVVIRHSIPSSGTEGPSGYLLRGGSNEDCFWERSRKT